jgi:hypothetical protein
MFVKGNLVNDKRRLSLPHHWRHASRRRARKRQGGETGVDSQVWLKEQLAAGEAKLTDLAKAVKKIGIIRPRLYKAAEHLGVKLATLGTGPT